MIKAISRVAAILAVGVLLAACQSVETVQIMGVEAYYVPGPRPLANATSIVATYPKRELDYSTFKPFGGTTVAPLVEEPDLGDIIRLNVERGLRDYVAVDPGSEWRLSAEVTRSYPYATWYDSPAALIPFVGLIVAIDEIVNREIDLRYDIAVVLTATHRSGAVRTATFQRIYQKDNQPGSVYSKPGAVVKEFIESFNREFARELPGMLATLYAPITS